jgi:hypothetical protein
MLVPFYTLNFVRYKLLLYLNSFKMSKITIPFLDLRIEIRFADDGMKISTLEIALQIFLLSLN